MSTDLTNSFFVRFGKRYSVQNRLKITDIPFHEHPQFSMITDILSRKEKHHAFLCTDFSATMHPFFLEALLLHFCNAHISPLLCNAELIYLNLENDVFIYNESMHLEQDFLHLRQLLQDENKYTLFAMSADLLLSNHTPPELRAQLEGLLSHPQCRFLIFSPGTQRKQAQRFANRVSFLTLNKATIADKMFILKHQRADLENFHNVQIPDALLTETYTLAERYLSAEDTLNNALLLLDSSAARTIMSGEPTTVQPATIMNVLSTWTQIPVSHLAFTPFNLNDFTHHMQQHVFGQDAAITVLAHKLQQQLPHFQPHAGPFCTFLFAGPDHAGKKTAAYALTEHLFKQSNVLYYAELASSHVQSIADIKLQRSLEHHYTPLKEVIHHTPHAVIMLENIDQASPAVLAGLFEIFSTGYLHDDDGHLYHFRQAIIILSTTLGSRRLSELAKVHAQLDEPKHLDLMQLVMVDPAQDPRQSGHHYSPQEVAQEIIPEITSCLPAALCQHLCIVPFLPLAQASIEKIIRLKMKELGKEMQARYGMELGYAPEVIRFLAKESADADIKKALQPLYFSVEQAMLSLTDGDNRPNQLFLQLNETGQFLRCDCLTIVDEALCSVPSP